MRKDQIWPSEGQVVAGRCADSADQNVGRVVTKQYRSCFEHETSEAKHASVRNDPSKRRESGPRLTSLCGAASCIGMEYGMSVVDGAGA